MPIIKVKHSGLIEGLVVPQEKRGTLWSLESQRLPFAPKRVYAVFGVGTGQMRGAHAHKKTDQAVFVLSGAFTLGLDDGESKQEICLNDPHWGVRLGPMLWHTMSEFSPDCVVLVVANLSYDETDYIKDYATFKKYANTF